MGEDCVRRRPPSNCLRGGWENRVLLRLRHHSKPDLWGRPYAFVENVVTHTDYRGKGYATACLNYAREMAQNANCYKMMLLTGSKSPKTLAFYQNAGYNSSDKTAFIQWL